MQDINNVQDQVAEFTAEQQFERLVYRALGRLDWCRSSDDRKKAEQRWQDAQNFWLGKQWDGIKSYGIKGRDADTKRLHPNPVDNYFKAHMEGLVGDITDKPADIQVRPQEDGDDVIARKLGHSIDYLWYRNNGDRKLEFAVRRGVLYGPLIAKVFWDNDWRGTPHNSFVGDVRFISVLPTNIFIDPRVKAVEEKVLQKAEFIIYGVRRSLDYVRQQYPERGHDVSADTYASYVTTITGAEDDDGPDMGDTEVLVIEYWYRGDPQAPDFPKNVDSQADPAELLELRDGWVHKAVIAGGVLLEHRTYVYPWYPFVLEWLYQSDESIYGYGDAHDILLPQLMINKLNEISIEGAVLTSQGNWLTEEHNIRNQNQFQMYAGMGGAVLPVVDVGRTTRVSGGNVPNSLFTHYRQELSAMETICGRYDVAQGRTPRNIQAASAIALLLQQAGGRVRQRSRAVASFVEQIVSMMIGLIGQHYTEERVIRIVGQDSEPHWDTVSRADFLKTKVWVDPITGQEMREEYVPEMDIIVRAGADTPMSKAYYSQMAMQLFTAGVIDDIALLDNIQFPHWREILARKQAAEQQQMAMQQQMAQPQPQPQQAVPAAPPIPDQQMLEQQMLEQLMLEQQAGAGAGVGMDTGVGGLPPELLAMLGAGAVPPPVQAGGSPNEIAQLLAMLQALQQQEGL